MPYEMRESPKGYCVHKQGDSGPALGCHKSKSRALRQMKALYANEPELMREKASDIDFTPPESVRSTAAAGLAKRREHGRGGTAIGIARARDLSGNRRMSPSTIKRMVSFFARHAVDKNARGFNQGEEGYPSNGRIAWELWGGDAGQAWANKVARQMMSESTKADGKGYGARAGETIRGNLSRGGDGKFASGGTAAEPAAEAEAPAPRLRRQRLGRTEAAREERKRQAREAKQQATAVERDKNRQARAAATEQRKRERDARRAEAKRRKAEEKQRQLEENRKSVLEATGVPDNVMRGLEDFAAGADIEFDSELADALTAAGLLVPTGPGRESYKLGAAGRALLAAAKSGDIRQAKDALANGLEAVRKRREARKREIERMEAAQEKEAGLSVFKDASGRYRWVLLSSNAYRDKDGEIVSTKALADDVARADADKDYGPLRWWHVPGADIGDCDFNAMSGRVLVESGTFRSEAIGRAVHKAQAGLQASLGFRHPSSEPDHEKVYHHIRRFERSLVPVGRAANRFTRLVVKQGGKQMDTEKLEALKAIIGEEGIATLIAQVRATEKEAAGVAFKSDEKPAPESPSLSVGDVVTAIKAPTVTTGTSASLGVTNTGSAFTLTRRKAEGEDAEKMDASEDGDEGDTEEMIYAGDMPPADLASLIADAVVQAMSPLLAGMAEQAKSLSESRVKSDDIALLQEQQARKALEDDKARATIQTKMVELETQLKEAKGALAELTGEQPRASQTGYRASQATDSVTAANHALKEAAPVGLDPNFFADFIGGNAAPKPPHY